jgi:AraC-like DNA-binding protein
MLDGKGVRCIVFFRHGVEVTEAAFPHLSDVGFERVAPSPALRPFVQWYWQIQSRGRVVTPRHEFMHADGSVGLVFNWGDALELSGGRFPQSISLDSISVRSKQLNLRGHVAAFGILFQPGGSFPVLGIPMPELVSIEVLLAQTACRDLPQLYEQLAEMATLQERIALVEGWLERRLRDARPQSPVITPSLAYINRANGQLAMPHLAEAVSLGQRQLERLYQEQVGLSPKKMAQLRRVRQARTLLKQGIHPLTDIAYQCSFYDQAHFIREFKAVTGLTPGAYLVRQQKRGAPP